jgi:glycosyltransferase involved in cell wall biosynthesis
MADDFDALMEGLEGGITTHEAALLRRLAASASGGCIIEVGSWRGKSAVALALGVRDRAAPIPIFCIEPHRPFVGFYGGQFGPTDRGVFYRVMQRTGAFREVALVNLSSEDVAATWASPVGLAFIDGDHRHAQVRRDFECWDRHVVLGGLIAFDDAIDPACGPARLVAEIVQTGCYRIIETVGKIVVLQKLRHAERGVPAWPHRLLVACHDIVMSGGLLRFERLAATLRRDGHELAFVRLADSSAPEWQPQSPVLSLAEAASAEWDAVMVPGAGFPDETIERFARLRAPNFGLRMQHVLNDRTLRERFLRVNAAFAPDVVVFNNADWPVGSFTEFQARRFHVLPGAVDIRSFRPPAYRSHPLVPGKWIVGGQASKNPGPLVEALGMLPATVSLRLYGPDRLGLAGRCAELVAAGRLHLAGPLEEAPLRAFYHDVDCVVMTELHAGWANLAAEAMASGTPLICTPHGTSAFARDAETALLVEDADAEAIAAAIERLRTDAVLCRQLAERGREVISDYSWDDYARGLLALLGADESVHYLHLPEAGLFGKWSLADRLAGLGPLLERARGQSVIDFGCAEGVVAREFLRRGAALVHGFELDPDRVRLAHALCAGYPGATFRRADLSDPTGFRAAHADLLRETYDGVLYLGIHHHLDPAARTTMLHQALALAGRWFAIRTPATLAQEDRIDAIVTQAGFRRIESGDERERSANLGDLALYERNPPRGTT